MANLFFIYRVLFWLWLFYVAISLFLSLKIATSDCSHLQRFKYEFWCLDKMLSHIVNHHSHIWHANAWHDITSQHWHLTPNKTAFIIKEQSHCTVIALINCWWETELWQEMRCWSNGRVPLISLSFLVDMIPLEFKATALKWCPWSLKEHSWNIHCNGSSDSLWWMSRRSATYHWDLPWCSIQGLQWFLRCCEQGTRIIHWKAIITRTVRCIKGKNANEISGMCWLSWWFLPVYQ